MVAVHDRNEVLARFLHQQDELLVAAARLLAQPLKEGIDRTRRPVAPARRVAVRLGIAWGHAPAHDLVDLHGIEACFLALLNRVGQERASEGRRRADLGVLAHATIHPPEALWLPIDAHDGPLLGVLPEIGFILIVEAIVALPQSPLQAGEEDQRAIPRLLQGADQILEACGAPHGREVIGRNPRSMLFPAHQHRHDRGTKLLLILGHLVGDESEPLAFAALGQVTT